MFKNVECSEQIVKTVASIVSAMYCHNPKIFPCTEQLSPQFTMHSCPDSPSRQLADRVSLKQTSYCNTFLTRFSFALFIRFAIICPSSGDVLEAMRSQYLKSKCQKYYYTLYSRLYTCRHQQFILSLILCSSCCTIIIMLLLTACYYYMIIVNKRTQIPQKTQTITQRKY